MMIDCLLKILDILLRIIQILETINRLPRWERGKRYKQN